MSAELFLKAVADSTRLKILSSLTERPKFVEELAMELNIKLSTVSFHLKKLQTAGFVVSEKEQYYQIYSVNPLALERSILDIVTENRTISKNAFGKEVINESFENGRLKNLPIQIKKREVIYKEIIKLFDSNRVYTDREVNIIIADVYDDFIKIKNELIACGLLLRKGKWLKVSIDGSADTAEKTNKKRANKNAPYNVKK